MKICYKNNDHTMKKILFAVLLFLAVGQLGFAQDDTERIQQMRVEFFNRELQFTEAEAEAFWPIYRQFRIDQQNLEDTYRTKRRLELMSDAEAERYIEEHLELEEKKLALKRSYIGKLKQVISVRKIAMINRTERKFKQALLNKIKDRRQPQRRRFN